MSHVADIAPAQSYESIEGKALALRAMLRRYGVADEQAFPIIEVLEYAVPMLMPDFYFGVADAATLNGAEAFKTSDNKILVREDVYEDALMDQGRARFTLAHELGHLILHPVTILQRKATPPGMRLKTFHNPEWQADAFASAILMPRHIVQDMPIEEIVQLFKVSRSAATVRKDKIMKYK